ncbi:GNAT family N-acetyltransferase [Chitinimonas taiwanensis]|uniref:GNAT family N-acetyltransferase n=1 Tax=Chitinimonas taiwanensis TaxID=240412 RepID=UPI0035B2D968
MLPLRTARLLLRDFQADDASAYLHLREGVQFGRYYPAQECDHAASQQLLVRFIGWQHEQPRRQWQLAITRAADGALIGSCGVRVQPDGSASFGCELGEAWWGQGYAREAAQALLDFARDPLGVQVLDADTLLANTAAQQLALQLGFVALPEAGAAREFNGQSWPVLRLRKTLY